MQRVTWHSVGPGRRPISGSLSAVPRLPAPGHGVELTAHLALAHTDLRGHGQTRGPGGSSQYGEADNNPPAVFWGVGNVSSARQRSASCLPPCLAPVQAAAAPGRGSAAVSAGALRAGRPRAALRGTPRVKPGGCGWGTAGRAGYSQLGHVPGNALGEGAEPLVAASHHRLHAGALLRAARAQVTAALVVACGAPRASVAGDRCPQWGRASEAGCGDQGCAGRGPSALSRTGTTSLLASCVRGSGVPS